MKPVFGRPVLTGCSQGQLSVWGLDRADVVPRELLGFGVFGETALGLYAQERLYVLCAFGKHLTAMVTSRSGTRCGSLWGYVGGNVALYLCASTGEKRGQRRDDNGVLLELGPEDVLSKRVGLVVADASNMFEMSFLRDDLIECGCNAHARRRFVKAADGSDPRVALVVGAYRRLYEFEREGAQRSNDERLKVRQAKSQPVFYTLLASCALVDVDLEDYLTDVLPRLARGGLDAEQARTLLPHRWKIDRAAV